MLPKAKLLVEGHPGKSGLREFAILAGSVLKFDNDGLPVTVSPAELQTPWTQTVNAAGFGLTDALAVESKVFTVLDYISGLPKAFISFEGGNLLISNEGGDTRLSWNGAVWTFSGDVTAVNFNGALTGNVTGNVTGNLTGNVTGNAATATLAASATILATSRTINGVAFNGSANITIPADVSTQSALAYAATVDIDFNSDDFRPLDLTGNVTFTTSNRAAAKSVTLKILADASIRTFTFPAWKFIGAAAPASIAANKTAVLTLTAFGANDTDIVAAYAVEP